MASAAPQLFQPEPTDLLADALEIFASEAEAILRARRHTARESVLDFVPRISPRFMRPAHLAPLATAIERAHGGEPIRLLVSVPPRHSKTETVLHAIAWCLRQSPEMPLGYASYAADIARSKSRQARDYAREAGVEIREDADALHEWRTPAGGGLLATGIGGPLTGHGIRILFIDDPIKNREEADSLTIRDNIHGWFTSTAMTRIEPGGSVFVVHTRWHEDDLIGRLLAETRKHRDSAGSEGEHWDYLNLQVIDEGTGEALWPQRWPVDELRKKERSVGPYDWASLYQGRPRPKGGKLFREPARFETPEIAGRRLLIGVDVAGTRSSRANWTVAAVMAFAGSGDEMRCDVVEVVRLQEEIPTVCRAVEALQKKWGALLVVEASGLGKAVPQTLRDTNPRLRILEVHPTTDKFARAQSYAAGWNQGRVRVAARGEGVAEFVRVTTGFTGVNDAEDDDVDAGAHAWNAALGMAGRAEGVGEQGTGW